MAVEVEHVALEADIGEQIQVAQVEAAFAIVVRLLAQGRAQARLQLDGQLLRVRAPVDPDLESTALCLRALREGGPALLMERPGDSEGRQGFM